MIARVFSSLVLAIAIACGMASATANAEDARDAFPQMIVMTPTGVNMQTGRFSEEAVDMVLGPLTVDHYVSFTYHGGSAVGSSQPASVATSLKGDAMEYDATSETIEYVQLGKLMLKFHVGATSGDFFPFDSANTGWKMVVSGADYVLTNKSGDIYRFSTHPALSSKFRKLALRTSANGHRLDYSYDNSARLKLITSNRGFALVFDYASTTVTVCGFNTSESEVSVSSTCSGAALKTTYSYNSSGQLASITDPLGAVTNIGYTDYKPTCITLPDSSTCRIQNTYADTTAHPEYRPDQVVQQVTGAGEVLGYSYINIDDDDPVDNPTYPGEIRYTETWAAIHGAGGSYAKFANGFLDTMQTSDDVWLSFEHSSLATYWIQYTSGWSGPHYYSVYPSKVTYPEGNSTQTIRDWADNVTARIENPKPGSGDVSRAMTWTYPAANQWANPTICAAADVLCDKPTKVTDYEGNETDYVYDSVHGGLLKQTQPADSSGVRAQTRYSYSQHYAWQKASGGSHVQGSSPIWLLDAEEFCRTSSADASGNCAAGASDLVTITYQYEQGSPSKGSNLFLLGKAVTADGETLRTCYSYDEWGRKISETAPNANLASCP